MHKEVLSIDFDGTIHSYSSGWKGATQLPDPPVEGAFDWLRMLSFSDAYRLVINSARLHEPAAELAMVRWFIRHGLEPHVVDAIKFTVMKQGAKVLIDDRVILFEGPEAGFPSLQRIDDFVPWHKKETW